jgi:hypothetical protein
MPLGTLSNLKSPSLVVVVRITGVAASADPLAGVLRKSPICRWPKPCGGPPGANRDKYLPITVEPGAPPKATGAVGAVTCVPVRDWCGKLFERTSADPHPLIAAEKQRIVAAATTATP